MKTRCCALLIGILGLLLASCQLPSLLGPVEAKHARDLAWQALVEEYQPDEIVGTMTLGPCRQGKVLHLDRVHIPELEELFPGIQLFLGGLDMSCLPGPLPGGETPLDLIGYGTYKFIAVYQGQVYFLVSSMRRTPGHDAYVGFNRLLRQTGQEVTPDNEDRVARAVAAMVMYSYYADFFDADMWHEGLQPAKYCFGPFQPIDEYLDDKYQDKNEHFTLSWTTWNLPQGRVMKWRLAFFGGVPVLFKGECILSGVSGGNFETKPLDALAGNPDYCEPNVMSSIHPARD
jgi:hypothetical protein